MPKTKKRRKKKKSKRNRTAVSRPLSPTRLTELKALGTLPRPVRGFDPKKAFAHTYTLWITYGYANPRKNGSKGTLQLIKALPNGGSFGLDVTQTYDNAEGVSHTLKAKATCSNDTLALPKSWQIISTFSDTKATWGGLDKTLTADYKVTGNTLEVRTNGTSSKRALNGPTTSDWGLFEAVQRMPVDADFTARFDLLEGLSALRPGHRISYEGKVRHAWGKDTVQLHYYRQFGQGMLPYEYYLDDSHRLVMVVSGYRAYILKGGQA